MARFVDVEPYDKILEQREKALWEIDAPVVADAVGQCRKLLAKLPTAEVALVVHGRWEHLGGDEWCCTACGNVITTEGSWEKPTKKYCDECGAKMDVEVSY